MNRKKHSNGGARAMVYMMILSVTMACTLTNNGWAMLAPAQGAAAADVQGYDRAADMKTVQATLESKVVRERLKALGMTDKEIDSRLSQLTDQQVHQVAKDINTLRPGGFIESVLGLVIMVLLIVFLVHNI